MTAIFEWRCVVRDRPSLQLLTLAWRFTLPFLDKYKVSRPLFQHLQHLQNSCLYMGKTRRSASHIGASEG